MTKLVWDKVDERHYQSGLSNGVLYPKTGAGVVWNGLISITKNSIGGDVEALYFEGIKYFNLGSNKNFSAKITAFSAPLEFRRCLGTIEIAPGYMLGNQMREQFGLSYQTKTDVGYHIHIIYNASASPNSRGFTTLSDKPDPTVMEWEIDAVPIISTAHSASAHYIIDSNKMPPARLTTLENQLYGTSSTAPSLPTLGYILDLLSKEVES